METSRIGSGGIPLLDALLRGKNIQNLLPDLAVGDRLQGQVAGRMVGGKVLVLLKGVHVEAETNIPLKSGQKIAVQVESLKPQVMLRLLTVLPQNDPGNISQYLKIFRSNPQAAAEVFQGGMTLLGTDSQAVSSDDLIRSQTQSLAQLIRSLIFSDKTGKNPLFVRDFVQRSGLTFENILSQNFARGDFTPSGEINLKGALMKLAADIQKGLTARSVIPEQEKQAVMRLVDYAGKSVRTLETQQVINTVIRENENRFMLQIPFALPHDTAMQDIFIEFADDGEKGDNEGDRPFRIVFFLTLDILGEMIIDVRIKGQDLIADLSCQREEIAALVRSHIGSLQENLESIGFRITGMTCNVRQDIPEKKQDYMRKVSCYSDEEAVNIFV